ncbi:MAG: hypothetical protein A2787_05025 [Omnitrophica WOR_2 bacterium RIFCSPHIGHO2_01_FULL_48_9]|nr:MAG: hypothetical protein A3D10_02375 [Omnitrophica WOR_2 bacterium RIFCSPHIGHO2_02_FULL_48_11]OGX30586.1 MAG: hypothetical protein A2787_05025 [Omnitrophica WOR_2 bacterium RIFCSPHIGHO2_01_FULL_48_9]
MANKILVVDDDEEILNLLEKKLVSERYQVLKAARADEAINQARLYLPNLILMDIMLPDMDGAEAIMVLDRDPLTRRIPVIFLSGIVSKDATGNATVKVSGREYRAIPKPINPQDLMTEIKNIL